MTFGIMIDKSYDLFMKIKSCFISEARDKLYKILKQVANGENLYEITHRSGDSVIVMSKDDYESWQETLEILTSPNLMAELRESIKDKKLYSYTQVIAELGLKDEDLL